MDTENPLDTAASPDLSLRMRHEQVRLVYRNAPYVFISNLVIAAFMLYLLWDVVDHRQALLWLAWMEGVILVRVLLFLAYRRRERSPAEALRWGNRFMIGSAATGTLWGLAGILFFVPGAFHYQLFLLFIILAIGMESVHLAHYLPAFYAFIPVTVLPYGLLILQQDGRLYFMLSLMIFFYVVIFILFGRNQHATLTESLRLRYENLDLLAALERRKEEAERANVAKSRFLAAASHDLRQPAHAMGLFVAALERLLARPQPPQAEELRTVLASMRTTLGGLGGLLNALLDASRLDVGGLQVRRQAIPIQDLLNALHEEHRENAGQKGLDLRIRSASRWVDSDPELLKRILDNLIGNAVKYTRRGGVLVACRKRRAGVEIQVWDTGIGIAPENRQAIFEEFAQVDNAAHDREQGLGLGLAIVRQLADLLAHPLTLRSRPGRGSMFSVTVPSLAAPAEASVPAGEASASPAERRGTVIVLDDDHAIREALGKLLQSYGYLPVAGGHPRDVLPRLHPPSGPVLAILSDYHLASGITGERAIAALHAALQCPVPAILITGDTSPAGIRLASRSPYPVLYKPLDPSRLLAALDACAAGSQARKADSASAGPAI